MQGKRERAYKAGLIRIHARMSSRCVPALLRASAPALVPESWAPAVGAVLVVGGGVAAARHADWSGMCLLVATDLQLGEAQAHAARPCCRALRDQDFLQWPCVAFPCIHRFTACT